MFQIFPSGLDAALSPIVAAIHPLPVPIDSETQNARQSALLSPKEADGRVLLISQARRGSPARPGYYPLWMRCSRTGIVVPKQARRHPGHGQASMEDVDNGGEEKVTRPSEQAKKEARTQPRK